MYDNNLLGVAVLDRHVDMTEDHEGEILEMEEMFEHEKEAEMHDGQKIKEMLNV